MREGTTSAGTPDVELEDLLELFYGQPAGFSQLGEFHRVDTVPPPYDALLDHHKHMTVTVESHYGESVDVVVHRTRREGSWYAREITLVTTKSRRIVQYGIVLMNTALVDPQVWSRIESQEVPLGRVLIEHNVLREVQLCDLWRIESGPSLASLLHIRIGEVLFGRTALIYCDGEPAIELLEIVSPTEAA